jgi:hypothetical protein
MKIDLRFAETHAPVFISGELGGVNLGMKLEPKKRTGLTLQYDREHKELLVTFNGNTAIVPSTNVVTMIAAGPTAAKISVAEVKAAQKADTPVPSPLPTGGLHPAFQAQVSSPTDHVFAGPGKGKTK